MAEDKNQLKQGKLILSRKGYFTVEYGEKNCVCKAATRLRNEGIEPLCGDRVTFQDNNDGTGFITAISERTNRFPRPNVANADLLAIVVASAEPEPDLFYIDKMTCIGEISGVETVLVISKNDIKDGGELAEIYRKCGYKVFLTDKTPSKDIDGLKQLMKGKLTVLAGPSGVGKSSLLNAMYPSMNAQIGDISQRILRGKNTTRHTQLFPTENGGYIADTPGFTSIDFEKDNLLPFEALKNAFPEMQPYLTDCAYRNCNHTKEEGCAVIDAVEKGIIPKSRHESYVKLFEILKRNKYKNYKN